MWGKYIKKVDIKKTKINLLTGPIGKTIIKLAIPMSYGLFAVMLFNIVDTIYIARLGTNELAAMGFIYPVIFTIFGITLGISMGTTSVLSRAIGKGDKNHVKRLTTDSLILAVIIVTILGLIGLFTINPLFRFLGASSEIIILIKQYITILYLGIGFLVIPMVGNGAIRATGDTKTPSIIMIVAGVVNIILDPFFIFGIGFFPRLELQGAAIATVISWSITLIFSLWVLSKREKMLSFERIKLRTFFNSAKKILYIGVPSAATNVLMPLSIGILTKIVSGFGNSAVAGFGVSVRIESIALIGAMALSTAIMPMIGQNFGAKKYKRVLQILKVSKKYSIYWGLIAMVFLMALSSLLASIFNTDLMVRKVIVNFLLIIPISYGLYGVALVTSSGFNAVNKPWHATFLITLRLFVFAIPFAFILSKLIGINGIFLGISAANIIIGLIAIFWVKKYLLKIGG